MKRVPPPGETQDPAIGQEVAKRFGHHFGKYSIFSDATHSPPLLPTRLRVSAPGDRSEREADQIANRVVARRGVPTGLSITPVSVPQRAPQPTEGGREGEGTEAADPGVARAIQQARGQGQPIEAKAREPMERALGADFRGVKIHTDVESDKLNRSLRSRAFASGRDLFFRQGAYHPESEQGQRLIAHELTHVAQQSIHSSDPVTIQRYIEFQSDSSGGLIPFENYQGKPGHYYDYIERRHRLFDWNRWDTDPAYKQWFVNNPSRVFPSTTKTSTTTSTSTSTSTSTTTTTTTSDQDQQLLSSNGIRNKKTAKEVIFPYSRSNPELAKSLFEAFNRKNPGNELTLKQAGLEERRESRASTTTTSSTSSSSITRSSVSQEEIGNKWSPGKSGDGYKNARAHWAKHSKVDGVNHASSSFSERGELEATNSYVNHAYRFVNRHRAGAFTQKNFTDDGGEPKNVTIYFSHDARTDEATIAVRDQDTGSLRSFYDLNPSIHGASSNAVWLAANGSESMQRRLQKAEEEYGIKRNEWTPKDGPLPEEDSSSSSRRELSEERGSEKEKQRGSTSLSNRSTSSTRASTTTSFSSSSSSSSSSRRQIGETKTARHERSRSRSPVGGRDDSRDSRRNRDRDRSRDRYRDRERERSRRRSRSRSRNRKRKRDSGENG